MALRRGFLPDIDDLLAFEATARHGSVSRAAEELSLTQSAVSRQIQRLEAGLGIMLFHRRRQRVLLTETGRLYATHVAASLAELSKVTHEAIALSGTRGVLNLAVLPTFGTRWLIPRLESFHALAPDVTVNLAVRVVPFDFAAEPFDAAIHVGRPHWPGAVMTRLRSEEMVVVASPAYRDRMDLEAPGDLARATLLQQTTRPDSWANWFAVAGITATNALRGPRFEQFGMVTEAAAAGLGAALVPDFLIESDLASGRLTVLFPRRLPSGGAYYLVVPEAKAETPLIRLFRDWIVGEAEGEISGTSAP